MISNFVLLILEVAVREFPGASDAPGVHQIVGFCGE
jgi:hypothetical protein